MKVSAIAIISKNRGLGFENHLLFHIPGELPRFKQITMGHSVIMGRKTHESIGRVLPGRLNIVITRNGGTDVPGSLIFVDSLEKALQIGKDYEESRIKNQESRQREKNNNSSFMIHNSGENEVFILGGGQIFQKALPLTDRLYLTIVDCEVKADTFFPEYEKEFTKVLKEQKMTDWKHQYRFITLERKSKQTKYTPDVF